MEASKESCSFIFFSVPPFWRQTNSPLLAHFISFRGYGTDWVSTVVAIEAYGSKATVEENLRGRRCNRKDQNNSAGLTRGTIQFVMWNHGLSVAQWERVPGETAQQSACEWPRVRRLTGFLFFFFFITCNFSNHKSAFTPWLHRCTSGTHKPKMMRGVQGWFGSLWCHGWPGQLFLSVASEAFVLWWLTVEKCATVFYCSWRPFAYLTEIFFFFGGGG